MYLEMKSEPLDFIHKGCRVNFNQYLLKKDPYELVIIFHAAQETESKPGDFCNLVFTAIENVCIHIERNYIENACTKQYEKIVQNKVRKAAFK